MYYNKLIKFLVILIAVIGILIAIMGIVDKNFLFTPIIFVLLGAQQLLLSYNSYKMKKKSTEVILSIIFGIFFIVITIPNIIGLLK